MVWTHSRGEPIAVTDPRASTVARTVKCREMLCVSVDTHILGVIALQTHNHLIDHLRAEEWIFAITFMVSGVYTGQQVVKYTYE